MANFGLSKRGNHNRTRKYPGIKGTRPDLHIIRAQEAAERLAVFSKLSPSEKIEVLDRRLGKGGGATKQRQRYALQIEKEREVAESRAILESRKKQEKATAKKKQ